MSLGHLARLRGTIDPQGADLVLRTLARDADVEGAVADALDDIAVFTGEWMTAA